MADLERYGIMNDIHFPFEDKSRYKLALKIFHDVGINQLFLNGDIGEFLGVSTHPSHPIDRIGFAKEVDYINNKFDELQSIFSDIPVTLICGNHCYRFFRFVRDVAPQMWGLLDCPALFKFPDRPGWKFVDYGPSQFVKCGAANLWLRHEPLAGGLAHAKGTAENSYVDIAYGHTHQYAVGTHKKIGPRPFLTKAYSLGWLGDETRNVFDYRGSKDRWVKGVTLVEACKKTGDYSLEFIDLTKIPVLYRGVRYNAK